MEYKEAISIETIRQEVVELEHQVRVVRRDIRNAEYQYEAVIGQNWRCFWELERQRLVLVWIDLEARLKACLLELQRNEANPIS